MQWITYKEERYCMCGNLNNSPMRQLARLRQDPSEREHTSMQRQ